MTSDEACLVSLWEAGLRSEGIGPQLEWEAVSPNEFQRRHNEWWCMVAAIVKAEPGTYDELPDWMTESATVQLLHN